MEALGWRMVKLCGGLPLAIIVLGGLLAAKHTLREWEMVYQNVWSHKWSNDHMQHDDGVSKDSVIDAKKLYHLWMVDGILAVDDRMEDETMLDVAERYLGALAQRCMVQVQVEKFTQRIKYCRIHDLMLELCLSKAKINDFIGIVYLQCETDLAYCFSTTPTITTKIRKLAIHLNMDVEKVVLPDLETTKQVLDLERLEFDEKSLESIGNLVSLRYLSLRCCSIPKWHSSICKLKYLQTLDLLDCYFNSGEVIVLHQMERLRHLYISYNSILRYKFKLDGLSNLETLEGFNTRNCDVNDLCKLINLQQLEEATFWKTDNQNFAAFINYLNISASHLRQTSLSVNFSSEEGELTLLKQLLGCHHLYNLTINGFIPELPEYQSLSPSLIKLKLFGCNLKKDPMPTLERLPNLQLLDLNANAFVGEKMVCSANGFPQLKTLYLYRLHHLKEWEVEKGAMLNLSSLYITCCKRLEMVPDGLRFIATFQQFTTGDMSTKFNNKLLKVNGEEGEDFYKVRHVTTISIR
ncbi:unnamed protein product [Camellia sinensis]